MGMKVRSVKLGPQQREALRAAANAKGITESDVVREALEQYVATQASGAPKQSVAARAADLAGCVTGPSDLSTNRRHLEGSGR